MNDTKDSEEKIDVIERTNTLLKQAASLVSVCEFLNRKVHRLEQRVRRLEQGEDIRWGHLRL